MNKDPINPTHYKHAGTTMELKEALEGLSTVEGYRCSMQNKVFEYVYRHHQKNGIEDLRKAIRCIEMLIEYEEKIESV